MSPHPRRRAAPAALVTSVALLLVMVAAQVVTDLSGSLDGVAPNDERAPFWRWLLESYNTFFGTDPLATGDHRLVETVVAGAVVLVVGFALAWLVVRGLAPGSGVLPMFLATWMVAVVATVAATLVRYVVVVLTTSGGADDGRSWYVLTVTGVSYGVRFGFVAAVLGALAWLTTRTRPQSGIAAAPSQTATSTPAPEREPAWVRDPPTGGAHADQSEE